MERWLLLKTAIQGGKEKYPPTYPTTHLTNQPTTLRLPTPPAPTYSAILLPITPCAPTCAVSFILMSTMDEISSGEKVLVSPLYCTSITGLSPGPA